MTKGVNEKNKKRIFLHPYFFLKPGSNFLIHECRQNVSSLILNRAFSKSVLADPEAALQLMLSIKKVNNTKSHPFVNAVYSKRKDIDQNKIKKDNVK